MKVMLSLAFCLLCSIHVIIGSEAEHKLINRLFSHYDPRVRPSKGSDEAVQLTIENIHLKRLTHINETDGTVDIGLWTGLSWNDTLLSWSPSMYSGVKYISVRASEVWTPDIILFSGWGVAEHSLRDSQENDVLIMSTGRVFYSPAVKLILPCLNKTASGDLECNFGLGSWVLSSDVLKLNLKHSELDTQKYVVDKKYNVEKTSLKHEVIKAAEWDKTWELGIVRITLKKK